MNLPLVSIIISTYNALQWLGEAVDSALSQTYLNCEVIVVDDGSTDGTDEFLKGHYGNRIRYFYKENGGLASARNLGLAQAQGNYIQFLDADDIISPEKVAAHVSFLESNPDYGVVYCHSLCFDDKTPEHKYDWSGKYLYKSGSVFSSMVDNGYILTHAALTRLSAIKSIEGFDENLPSCIDWDFWLRLSYSGTKFFYLDGPPMSLYRVREDALSARRVIHTAAGIAVLNKALRYVPDREKSLKNRIKRAIGRWRFAHGRALVESNSLLKGWPEMAKSLLKDQRNLRYKLVYMACSPFLGHTNTLKLLTSGQRIIRRNP